MPNLDKTGPNGKGPNTGRGKGNCSGNGANNLRGLGMGKRGGMGRCCDNNSGFSSLEEKEKFLLDELENIRKMKEKI